MHSGWGGNGTSISIDMISAKQLVGECLELGTTMLREIIQVYCNNNHIELPFAKQKNDFSAMSTYILDQSRFDKLAQTFIKEDLNSKKQFVRSWLYEMKSIRNAWAHWPSQNIDYRLANRAFDTLSMLFVGFGGNPHGELFSKIEFYRKKLLIVTAQKYLLESAPQG